VTSKKDADGSRVFFQLVRRLWWNRAWIVQEVDMARVFLICGHLMLNWKYLSRTAYVSGHGAVRIRKILLLREYFHSSSLLEPDPSNITMNAVHPVAFRRDWKNSDIRGPICAPLPEVLDIAWRRECQDPRDKLYAFHSFLSHEAQEAFQLNYNKTVLDLYQ
jgi:hypothetical protein